LGLFDVVGGGACSVISRRIALFVSVCPWPETFTETSAHRQHERRIRVVREEVLEAVDINRADDFEKASILGNSFASYGVIGF
jgi:hypothetical protein